jgi:hypothetical protein
LAMDANSVELASAHAMHEDLDKNPCVRVQACEIM